MRISDFQLMCDSYDSKLGLTNDLKITDQSNRTYEFSPY